MKVFILAGGLGTRLAEYTKTIPKPMVKVLGYPILIHIMKHYIMNQVFSQSCSKILLMEILLEGFSIFIYLINFLISRNACFFSVL